MKRLEKVSRVRAGGTNVTLCQSGEERIAAFRKIVEEKSFAIIDNVTVDLFSASHVVQVYDAINDANKAKYRELPVQKMVGIAYALAK